MALAQNGKINLITNAQAIGLHGNGVLKEIVIEEEGKENYTYQADHFIPLFGLAPKLGPIGDWGLEIRDNAIVVDTLDDIDPNDYL